MPGAPYHARVSDLPQESRGGGSYVRTALITDESLTSFVHLNVDFGKDAPPRFAHAHPFDQLLYVISGAMDFWVEDQTYRLESDHAIYIPRDRMHGGGNVSEEGCYLLEIFAPIRTDYLYTAEHQTSAGAPDRESDGSRVDTRTFGETLMAMSDSLLRQT